MAGKGGTVAITIVAGLVAAVLIAAVVVYTGAYNVAADAPHTGIVFSILNHERANAIAARAKNIQVPADLSDDRRVRAGASEYAEMCSQCHLGPGMEKSEISQGLYPTAPELSRGDPLSAQEQFWVVKHGIKFTSMPAWGPTHDDDMIWNIVAFVRKLPTLSPERFKALTRNASEEHEQMMHDHDETPGMKMPAQGHH